MQKLLIILIFLLVSCESELNVDPNLSESFKRYLYIQKLSNDSVITDQLSHFYLDSLNLNKLELISFQDQFNKDIQFRKLVLNQIRGQLDTLIYKNIYLEIDQLKKKKNNEKDLIKSKR